MSDSRATPRPWRLSDDHRIRRVIKGTGDKSASIVIIEEWTKEADAALIVEAVNSHDALKAQNAEMVKALRGLVDYNTGPLGGPPEIWAAARAALAKAGGK